MAVHQFMLSCVLATIFPDAVWSGTYCYYYYYSYYCYYYYYNYDIPIGSIIGAVVGGIISLIFLCVIIVAVCMVCCKKKTTGTQHIIHIPSILKVGEYSQQLHPIRDIAIAINNRIHPRHLCHRRCPRRRMPRAWFPDNPYDFLKRTTGTVIKPPGVSTMPSKVGACTCQSYYDNVPARETAGPTLSAGVISGIVLGVFLTIVGACICQAYYTTTTAAPQTLSSGVIAGIVIGVMMTIGGCCRSAGVVAGIVIGVLVGIGCCCVLVCCSVAGASQMASKITLLPLEAYYLSGLIRPTWCEEDTTRFGHG
uniref:Cysteine and tyrosine-rich protein 1 n=1 Tax=Magallana gigas TaxID=29159 RepID=K1QSS0_MAGGI